MRRVRRACLLAGALWMGLNAALCAAVALVALASAASGSGGGSAVAGAVGLAAFSAAGVGLCPRARSRPSPRSALAAGALGAVYVGAILAAWFGPRGPFAPSGDAPWWLGGAMALAEALLLASAAISAPLGRWWDATGAFALLFGLGGGGAAVLGPALSAATAARRAPPAPSAGPRGPRAPRG